jgi:hypothetical protein
MHIRTKIDNYLDLPSVIYRNVRWIIKSNDKNRITTAEMELIIRNQTFKKIRVEYERNEHVLKDLKQNLYWKTL